MSEKALILGGGGHVGTAFVRHLRRTGVEVVVMSRADADYFRPELLREAIQRLGATVLVNCAGYTGKPNVDACESHKHECLLGNAVLPGIIREVCECLKLPWIHVSSGCIYSGNTPDGMGFREGDLPNFCFRSPPCSFYSGTKALGEEVLAGAERCHILRLRIPFNHEDGPRNYLSKLLRYERILNAVNSLSQLDDFVEAAWSLHVKRAPAGIYNMTNPGHVSAEEVIQMMVQAGLTRKKFQFFTDEAEFMAKAAITPRSNCVLNTDKLRATGIVMRHVREALEWSIREFKITN